MIKRSELVRLAKQTGVNHPEIVETEYVNGILIDAMSRVLTKEQFAIHGGTCRNKAYNGMPGVYSNEEIDEYFKRNRFSKDIDSYIAPALNNEKEIKNILHASSDFIYRDFGVRLHVEDMSIMGKAPPKSHPFKHPRVDVYIPYEGPMASEKHHFPKIKLTLDSDDSPILLTTRRMIYHPFSDRQENDLIGNCFSFTELFARKLLVMYLRKEGRDLYDVAILLSTYDIMSHLDDVRKVLREKARRYDVKLPENLIGFEDALRASWDKTIMRMIQKPLPFEECMSQLRTVFDKINRTKEQYKLSVLNNINER
ncbi:MAG: nucleotidyl transferase AbiEii/AbiGii toxin family protein [Rickettsiales bacterium]|jgi:predicted nucleotidyltransferase component of viral defense system|nr:nucleotidyl transferase AbiEii/AbiGii toxin family protein [Rickettsiales bacterium]